MEGQGGVCGDGLGLFGYWFGFFMVVFVVVGGRGG